MTNISTLPKSDIVSDAEPELALVEVASAKSKTSTRALRSPNSIGNTHRD